MHIQRKLRRRGSSTDPRPSRILDRFLPPSRTALRVPPRVLRRIIRQSSLASASPPTGQTRKPPLRPRSLLWQFPSRAPTARSAQNANLGTLLSCRTALSGWLRSGTTVCLRGSFTSEWMHYGVRRRILQSTCQNAAGSVNSPREEGAFTPRSELWTSGRSLSFVKTDQNLRVALNALIKFFVSLGSLVDPNVVANNHARLGPAIHDQIAKIFVVFFDRSLSAAHGDSLIEVFRH